MELNSAVQEEIEGAESLTKRFLLYIFHLVYITEVHRDTTFHTLMIKL